MNKSSIIDNIDGLGLFDVLCGKDKQAYSHVGNKRFRVIVNINLPRYMACKSRFEKSTMIYSLTEELRSSCGIKFMQRAKIHNKQNGNDDTLIELDSKKSREKVAHALRDAVIIHYKGGKKKKMKNKKKQKLKLKLKFLLFIILARVSNLNVTKNKTALEANTPTHDNGNNAAARVLPPVQHKDAYEKYPGTVLMTYGKKISNINQSMTNYIKKR